MFVWVCEEWNLCPVRTALSDLILRGWNKGYASCEFLLASSMKSPKLHSLPTPVFPNVLLLAPQHHICSAPTWCDAGCSSAAHLRLQSCATAALGFASA